MNTTFNVNGIRVVNIKNNSGIAFFGIGILNGSNFENPKVAGISHFIEHMFFKGTETRNWEQIAREFAKLGVNNNAYTSRTEVLYHATCPKENLEPVIDLLMDMFFNSTLPEEEIEKERGVIIEEKKMYDDDPKSVFNDRTLENFIVWEKGHDTIGTFDTIGSIQRSDMVDYLNTTINFNNFVFVCCGDIDTADLRRYIEKRVPSSHSFLKSGKTNSVSNELWTAAIDNKAIPSFEYKRDNIEQSSVLRVNGGLSHFDNCYYTSAMLNKCLGGGMYSSLFAKLREELGLCYSCGLINIPIAYPHHTINYLYGYTSPNNVDSFIEEGENILKSVIKNGIDSELFECAKADLLGSILRRTETSSGKALFLLPRYLFQRGTNVEVVAGKIRDIKIEDCNALVEKLYNDEGNWAVMNPTGDEEK